MILFAVLNLPKLGLFFSQLNHVNIKMYELNLCEIYVFKISFGGTPVCLCLCAHMFAKIFDVHRSL